MVAVLTHKGRSADSGHYVAWVKQENGKFSGSGQFDYFVSNVFVLQLMISFFTGKWIEFDDDNPIPQREEDITKLSGGGKHAFISHHIFKWQNFKNLAASQQYVLIALFLPLISVSCGFR